MTEDPMGQSRIGWLNEKASKLRDILAHEGEEAAKEYACRIGEPQLLASVKREVPQRRVLTIPSRTVH